MQSLQSALGYGQFAGVSTLPWGLDNSPLIAQLFSPDKTEHELGVDSAIALFVEMRHAAEAVGAWKSLSQHHSPYRERTQGIAKAFAVGIGPVAGKFPVHDRGEWKHYTLRSMQQLVLFFRVVELLSENNQNEISVYAQDPSFTRLDNEFFESLGVQVAKSPHGDALVDDTSLVYAPFVPITHSCNTLTCCPRHTPCVYIGHKIDDLIEGPGRVPYIFGNLDTNEKARMVEQLKGRKTEYDMVESCMFGSDLARSGHLAVKIHVLKEGSPARDRSQACTPSCSRGEESVGVSVPIFRVT